MSIRPDMYGEVRFRIPLVFIIPIGALAAIAAVTVGFSRVLLNVPKEAAVAIATVMAFNILMACAVIATRPRMNSVQMAELAVVALYPVIVGIAIWQFGLGTESEAAAETKAPAGAGTQLVAQDSEFDSDELQVTAGEEATVSVDNQDSVEHSFSVYETSADADAQQNAVFDGPNVSGGENEDYEFTIKKSGNYVFQCDIHPSMRGTLTAK
jgi:plastocyanin